MGQQDNTKPNGTPHSKWKGNRKTISWSGGPADGIRHLVGALTDNGNAVLFSRTLDGGALGIQVLAGNERTKEYVSDLADITPLFAWLLETYG